MTLSLRNREFTRHAVFAGMRMPQILLRQHLPYVMPIIFFTAMNNLIWAIGLEVTLSVLGFSDINRPTIGGMIYWANAAPAIVAGIWWWIAFPMRLRRACCSSACSCWRCRSTSISTRAAASAGWELTCAMRSRPDTGPRRS